MEITNNSRYYSIPLVVGRRIAQIVFFDTEGIEKHSYESSGKYQTRYERFELRPNFRDAPNSPAPKTDPRAFSRSSDLSVLKESWDPMCMLPKMYQDREVRAMKASSEASPSN